MTASEALAPGIDRLLGHTEALGDPSAPSGIPERRRVLST